MTTFERRDRRPTAADGSDPALDSLVVLVAESHGYGCRAVPGDVMLLDGPQRLHIGMRNLRQLARLVPRDDWPALVADHVGTIITAIEEPLDLSDFALVRGLLRSRIYPAEARTARLISRPFAPGLIEAIVADTPTTVRTVVTDDVVGWPVTADELFAVGRDGVRADGPLECDVIDDTGIRVLEGSTFYAATHLVWLESYLDPGPYGVLAVAPTRSTIAACTIRKDTALISAERLRAFAADTHEDGPGSLTPDLFWWHRGGSLTLLERANTGPARLPEDFLRFVASLP
ncbi:hypothetical protein [Actinoallomurus acaciae]|uniref:Uncharacterized protein n=1 Tax=Actinoallomurus acaciae TaxID=502577 RepID=A0ABV5YGZ8_9ACTN